MVNKLLALGILTCIIFIVTMHYDDTSNRHIVAAEAISPEVVQELKEEDVFPERNMIHIPSIDSYVAIDEGEYEDIKTYTNTWRRTHTSTPDEGGNTVIVGHRYRDNSPDYPLYEIEQITVGDEIKLYWDKREYTYTVSSTMTVPETRVDLEDDTNEPILTLYACDWTGKKRLVVQAELTTSRSESTLENPIAEL